MAHVLAVSLSPAHGFSKTPQASIRLLEGEGVQGDAHCGPTVQHLYLKRKNPAAPNLMQVHLLSSELLDELALAGFPVGAGELGENVTTSGIDLLTLPHGTRLHLGGEAVVQLTGLRSPCKQIDSFRPGVQRLVTDRTHAPRFRGRAGVMAVVCRGGTVLPGDALQVELPPAAQRQRLVCI